MMLDDFKLLIGKDIDDALVNLYISKAQTKFKNYCKRQDIPDDAQSSIVDYVIIMFNKRGSEGLSSESYSGVNNTYETGIPEDIISEWDAFKSRKARFL